MNAARRAMTILVDPGAAWAAIDKEPGDIVYLLIRYVAVLALVPAVFGFVGATLIGGVLPNGETVRAPLFNGVFGAIFGYVLAFVTVLILGIIVSLVAPLFGGRRDFDKAFKLVAYALTPVWLAGIFLVLPGLQFLTLTGCYGAYILRLGLPRLLQIPQRQALSFAAIVVICAFALIYGSAVAQRMVFGTPGL